MKISKDQIIFLAIWAAGWAALRIVANFIGMATLIVMGKSSQVTDLGAIATVPVLSSCIVLLLIYRYWRSFKFPAVIQFVIFDAVALATAIWLQYEQAADISQSSARRGGLVVQHGTSLWSGLAEPVLFNVAGYGLAILLIMVLFKKNRRRSRKAAETDVPPDAGETKENPVLLAFSAIACVVFLTGLIMTLVHAGLLHFDVFMPFNNAHNPLLYTVVITLLVTSAGFLIGGRIFQGWYEPISIGASFSASFIFNSTAIAGAALPYILTAHYNWRLFLQFLGVALLLVFVHAVFFWFGARAK